MKNHTLSGLEIAVIGMAGRFPGATNIETFWENIISGKESISFFSDDELNESGVKPDLLKKNNYIRAGGVIENIEYFDASFFGYSPKDIQEMDPQIRLFFECASEALEDAGYDGEHLDDLVGVYVGASPNPYWESYSYLQSGLGELVNNKDYMSTLLSYKLNLKGPSITIYTACSTSLVAIHMACRSLLSGECNIAIAGGVSVQVPQKRGYLFQEGMIQSQDGHCRSFDIKANGTVFGNGVGIVILKPLTNSLADGDNIQAVIKGSAVNNDGDRKVGYTAPSLKGQADVILDAIQMAEIEPESISYIETHGTGTNLGDPVEFKALNRIFKPDKIKFCALGSVKTNVGHLNAAAGVAGFIKTILLLKNKVLPVTPHFENPNRQIDFVNSPFYINTYKKKWKSTKFPLRAGVSSFGIGGTNAHIILEDAPGRKVLPESRKNQILLLSAKTESALNKITENLVRYLKNNQNMNLADVAYTLKIGRKTYEYKKKIEVSNIKETIEALSTSNSEKAETFFSESNRKFVVFMFPGQGSQYVNMGLEIYRTESAFRKKVDFCFDLLKTKINYNCINILYPKGDKIRVSPIDDLINQTEVAQPIIFVFEYALAKLLIKWGIKPAAFIGHSIGEIVAACLSGVFSLEDALELVAFRGKMMQKMPRGAMLSIPLAEKDVKLLLNEKVSLAAINHPENCVVSGCQKAISSLKNHLKKKGINSILLRISHAFHSSMMDPILNEFEKKVEKLKLNTPNFPFISNLTGKWIRNEEAVDFKYWTKQLRNTVRFVNGVQELLRIDNTIFIEIGPDRILSNYIKKHPWKKSNQGIINIIRNPREQIPDDLYLLRKIGQIWLNGVKINWHKYYADENRYRVSLPTYPFEREYFSLKKIPHKFDTEMQVQKDALMKKSDITDWFYIPSWKRTFSQVPKKEEKTVHSNWLFFIDECNIGTQLIKRIKDINNHITIVKIGSEFCYQGARLFKINPKKKNDYDQLFNLLVLQKKIPNRIIHLWNVTKNSKLEFDERVNNYNKFQNLGFYSLIYLAQAIGKQNFSHKIQIKVLTNGIYEVTGNEYLHPEKATIQGPVKIIPQEYPNIKCCNIDIVLPKKIELEDNILLAPLSVELKNDISDRIIALRGRHRLLPNFVPIKLPETASGPIQLREGGVYLITGGLGGIGLTLAEHLATRVRCKLILISKTIFPTKNKWETLLTNLEKKDGLYHKILKIKEIEKKGTEVLVFSADVSDFRKMQDIFKSIDSTYGRLNGVIHAAGIASGGLIQRKTREMFEKVLLPKVKGTMVLNILLKKYKIDFFVLCSSLHSILSTFGQVDYCAGNAFLDAFASYKTSQDNAFTISVNWDSWNEVGMAFEAAKLYVRNKENLEFRPLKISHPLLDKLTNEDFKKKVYLTNFNLKKHWVLNEHKIFDTNEGLLPGVAYLEMARAAFENHTEAEMIEIKNVSFLNLFRVEEKEEKEIFFILNKQSDSYEFLFQSRSRSQKGKWVKHAIGHINISEKLEKTKYEIKDFEEKCNDKKVILKEKTKNYPGGLLHFGPRWESVRWIRYGENQALAFLKMPDSFSDDFKKFKLHPALLDCATSVLYSHINPKNIYMPFSYKKIIIKGRMPEKIYCYCQYIEESKIRKDLLKFNVSIMNEQGHELVSIEEFSMLAVTDEIKKRIKTREKSDNEELYYFNSELNALDKKWTYETGKDYLKYSINPSEGIDVFSRILKTSLSQIIVSTVDLNKKIQQRKALKTYSYQNGTKDVIQPGYNRPQMSTVYIAPKTEIEKKLTFMWQEFFGIKKIGINDDFFELLGDSLNAIPKGGEILK